jgi:hypothetical protein
VRFYQAYGKFYIGIKARPTDFDAKVKFAVGATIPHPKIKPANEHTLPSFAP